jgi:hypothetical protein
MPDKLLVRVGVRIFAILVIVLAISPARADRSSSDDRHGFTVSAGGGLNLDTPFVEAQFGRRFVRAPHFELYVDYSYGAAISEFNFQTFGIGARTYFSHYGRVEVFHQALMAFGVSASGNSTVEDRGFGERVLGAFMEQGIGVQVALTDGWRLATVVSVGYPVWLRSELAVRYAF